MKGRGEPQILSFRATWRTRSRSLDTPSPALRPGRVSPAVFPSGRPLPPPPPPPPPWGCSAASPVVRACLTSRARASRDYRLSVSPRDPPGAWSATREPSWTGHHQRPAGDHEISRVSCMELVVRALDLLTAQARQRLAYNAATVSPSAMGRVGTWNQCGFAAQYPARTPSVNASLRPRGSPTHDSGPTRLLDLRCRALSSPAPCRFIPTLSHQTSCRRPRSQPEGRGPK